MQPLTLTFLLLLIGVALIALEIFIPSGGIISVLAGLAFIAAIVAAWVAGPREGLIVTVVTLVSLPVIIFLGIKISPHTPVGRRLFIQPPAQDAIVDSNQVRSLKAQIGQIGRAKTKMLPSGVVIVDHTEYDAVSEGLPVEVGDTVKVVSVRMNRLLVRRLDERESRSQRPDPEDPLSRPIGELGIDPLEDPLA